MVQERQRRTKMERRASIENTISTALILPIFRQLRTAGRSPIKSLVVNLIGMIKPQ